MIPATRKKGLKRKKKKCENEYRRFAAKGNI
jgi:hypothetical protein